VSDSRCKESLGEADDVVKPVTHETVGAAAVRSTDLVRRATLRIKPMIVTSANPMQVMSIVRVTDAAFFGPSSKRASVPKTQALSRWPT